jgi:Flp pilus assembly protein TadG
MTHLITNIQSRLRNEDGAALVEFALVLPLLLVLLLGMVDLGKAYNYWIDETHLSNTAARWAAVNKNPGPGATLQQSIRDEADTDELKNGGTDSIANPVQVCVSFPNGTSNVGDPVKITVSADYNFLSFLTSQSGLTAKTITGSSTMRLEAVPTNFSAGCS